MKQKVYFRSKQLCQQNRNQMGKNDIKRMVQGQVGKIAEMPTEHKIGRNEKCPCGSGKKYKNCCLNNEVAK